ncbi:putative reverse transcriptase domain-containing protein [Tanacetum coccineum]
MIDQGITTTLAVRDADRNTNDDDSHNSGTSVRRIERTAREFENQVKIATCTLHSVALTWWNTHVKTVGHDAAYGMPWKTLMKMMTDKYCPRNEIKKLEIEIWDLKVKGTDLTSYTQCFQELALLSGKMIHGSVVASKPKTMQEAVEIATELLDKKIHSFADRQIENKRKQDNNQQQQQPPQNKRHNTGRAYVAGTGEKKLYGESKPLCPKCIYHHDGLCAPKFYKCNRVGHLARDCRSPANIPRGTRTGHKPTCYECGAQGYFKRECPKLKNNNNRGNSARNGNAPAKVYAVGHAGTNPDSNIVMGTFLLNNRYAFILFDTGADRSFMSTAFSPQIDITSTTLDHYYDVKLADGRIIRNWGNETRLHIISYTKTQEYMLKGCPVFLANVTTMEIEDKSEKKRLEDVPIVQDFPNVFPEDLPGLPPTRQVEFQIDLIPDAALVARAPY